MAKIETKEIMLKVKISPTITMHMGKTLLGRVTFDDLSDAGKFMRRLSKSIKQIIGEFKDEKEHTKNRGAKCRS